MNWLKNFAKGIASLFHRQDVERELDEELQGYLEASAAHKRRDGMTEEEARRAARVELASSNSVKHQIWSSRWESTLEGILQDVRVSVRTLLKSPGFTAVALLSLALGIGGNTAMFTLINQVLLRNLPVREPRQVVRIRRFHLRRRGRADKSWRFWRLFSLGFYSSGWSIIRDPFRASPRTEAFQIRSPSGGSDQRGGRRQFAGYAGSRQSCVRQLLQRAGSSTSVWPHDCAVGRRYSGKRSGGCAELSLLATVSLCRSAASWESLCRSTALRLKWWE